MTNPDQQLLAEAERRIAELEGELARERERTRYAERRLAAKEREVVEIHRSRAWGLIGTLRSLKYRYLDPLLGGIGISWPRRPVTASAAPQEVAPARAGVDDVICFSTCDWDSRFQRPQQLMAQFAAAGHRVFYVSQQFRRDGPAWSAARKRDNLYEVTLRGTALNVYTDHLGDPARELLFSGLEALRAHAAIGTAVMIVQLPFWGSLARQARQRFGWPIVYDCMDFHAGFSTVRRAMVADEEELLATADLVVASSTMLEQRALQHRAEVLVVRNACDYEHFAKTPAPNNARPVIGYYGAIGDWFDSALVAELARRRTGWDFVLVGSTFGADISALVRLPNVALPGEEAYESLPEWLGRFDVAIIPFKRTPLTEATNPVKVYEMLAGGRAVVSVPIPEVAALAPLVRLASNADEFEREIEAALAEEGGGKARRAFAKEHTWQKRFEVLEGAIAAMIRAAGA